MYNFSSYQGSILISIFAIFALSVATGMFLYHSTQDILFSETEIRIQKLVEAEEKKLTLLSNDWSSLLITASQQPELLRFALANFENDEKKLRTLKPALENVLVRYSRLKRGLLQKMRFIDKDGQEVILVRNGRIKHKYQNVSNESFFKESRRQVFNELYFPTYSKGTNHTNLEWSIALGKGDIFYGLFNITLNLSVINDMTTSAKQSGVFDRYYIVNPVGEQIYGDDPENFGKPIDFLNSNILNQSYYKDEKGNVIASSKIPPLNLYATLKIDAETLSEDHWEIFRPYIVLIALTGLTLIVLILIQSSRVKKLSEATSKIEYDRNILSKEVDKKTKELQVALDQAHRATQIKSEFLANMSHEIRTPLTAIIGFSKVLKSENIDVNRKKKTIRTIIKNSEHLLHIINDILDISKIEADKLEISNDKINLFQFMHDCKNVVAESILEKNLDFQVKYSYPLPIEFQSDEVRLTQILINLCSNARKFTKNGHVYIHVSYDEDRNLLSFAVEDTGIGLTKEQAEKIFSAFTQADSSTTKQYGGTGLGLSISQKLVNKLGGELKVESVKDVGSVFRFDIYPGEKASLTLCQEKQSHSSLKTNERGSQDLVFVSGSVLLVEDTVDNQELVKCYLEDLGAKVALAENGKIAVDMCKYQTYDLILMDMQMPVMGGVEAVEALRAMHYSGPIAMLTANAFEEDRERCVKAGCDEFLAKPIDEDALSRTVSKYLKASSDVEFIEEEIGNTVDLDDETYIISSLLGKKEKLDRLIFRFIEKLPKYLAEIANAFEDNDIVVLKEEAHRLKGAGGNYGYDAITNTCIEIETALKSDDKDAIRQLIADLNFIYIKIKKGTEIYQDNLGKTA